MRPYLKLVFAVAFLAGLILSCVCLPKLNSAEKLKEALFYDKLSDRIAQCRLCPRACVIPEGRRGFCGTRQNREGKLYSLVYARPVSIHIDPIEKKPLFHFLPATTSFSIATAGCNLKCKFCQNWQISQALPEELRYTCIEPQELVEKLKESGAKSIAYTYTEPTIFYEYVFETAKLVRKAGLANVMHSNGYINEKPLRELCPYLDAANIDLKGFTDEYYQQMSQGTLEPVLRSLKVLKEEGVHLEITNLVLPGYNDSEDEIIRMCLWIKENLGADTPVHFSRFSPMYKLTHLAPTAVETLERARKIALDCGLKYVFIGNVAGHPAESTYCPGCGRVLIERRGYFILRNDIKNGRCPFCGEEIEGVWK